MALLREYRADQELPKIQLGVGLKGSDFVFIRHEGSQILWKAEAGIRRQCRA